MKPNVRNFWGQKLLLFRTRAGFGQGELSHALSLICLPSGLSTGDSEFGENINLPNYELSRFEHGHRCPRRRSRHLALIYGLVQLGGIETPHEADEWLALADKRSLSDEERSLIFGVNTKVFPKETPEMHLEINLTPERLQYLEQTHRASYLQRILHKCEYLPLHEVGTTESASSLSTNLRIGLLDVYVDLDTTAKIELIDRGLTRRLPLSVVQALIREQRLVLLGAPGGGKSTFVNYLAYCLASYNLSEENEWLVRQLTHWPAAWAHHLPLPIILREVADWMKKFHRGQRGSRLLLDYLQFWLHQWVLDELYYVIKERLRQGRVLLLLDGLDEISDEEQFREPIKSMIVDLPVAFPQTPMMVTCRVLSYRLNDWQLDEVIWPVFELAELSNEQIAHFIHDWYQLLHVMQRVENAETLSNTLQEAVRRPDLLRLARNPLLLTVMSLLHSHKGQLPDARALLFESVVELLLWRWEAIKLRNPNGSETTWRQLLDAANVDDATLHHHLSELAFDLHERLGQGADSGSPAFDHTGTISGAELLARLRVLHPQRSLDWADRLVQIVQLRAGLLVEKSPGRFGFPHRTFEEYLAGCYLSRQRNFIQQAVSLTDKRGEWHEVILLAIGFLVHCTDSIERSLLLLGELCPDVAPALADKSGWQKIWLAGKALLEIGIPQLMSLQQGRALVERMRDHLTVLVTLDLLTPHLRAQAGVTLSVLGDARNLEEMVTVPAGPFEMGNSSTGRALFDEFGLPALLKLGIKEEDARTFLAAASQAHRVNLTTFQISRYPVTNGQYERFVRNTEHSPPEHWHGRVSPPELRNQPVVFVSWNDARAYCRWLSSVRDQFIRLPTEAEWEKAALGDGGHLFPWGNTFDPERHNSHQAGIGSISAVGIFRNGASKFGCLDMPGNVYEWTLSLWGEHPWQPEYTYPYIANDGRENTEAPPTVYRVIRGGAFYLQHVFTSCTYRDRDLPENRGRGIGFRVVVPL